MKLKMLFEKFRGQQNTAHLWLVNFEFAPASDLFISKSKILSTDELAYAAGCLEPRKREFLISRFALRMLLSDYFPSVSPRAWCFSRTKLGKPYVTGPIDISPLQFNISHTKDRAVIAFSLTQALGVDIEHRREFDAVQSIAESYFSYDEVLKIKTVNSLAAHRLFFDYWTLKESFIKATGHGFSFPLDELTFFIPDSSDESYSSKITLQVAKPDDTTAGFWTFKLISSEPDYQIAVAICTKLNHSVEVIEVGTFSNWT